MSTSIALARPAGFGLGAFAALLAIYFGALALVSGWSFTLAPFKEFWYYVLPLAAGFGVQVALFLKLREVVSRAKQAGAVIALRRWPALNRICGRLKRLEPIAPALTWLLLVVLHLVGGYLHLPRIKLWNP